MMIQDIFVIGATGNVGKTLIGQVITKRDTDSALHTNPTRIVGLASSSHAIYSQKGLSRQQALNFANKQYDEAKRYADLNELFELANKKSNESMLVFVDATSVNESMTQFHLNVIKNSQHGIVTANKNPVALPDYKTFQLLTEDTRRYGYRCSVMAGAEAVPFLRDLRDLNDSLYSVNGCLSGTLGYIASELEKGRSFSEILREAHVKGYTEPHPRDDLSGIDVARKMVVLARAAGFPVGLKDVQISPFIPKEFLSIDDISSFLNAAADLDMEFKRRIEDAKKGNNVLRYVAKMSAAGKTLSIQVSLKEVPQKSPLGTLQGTMNKIVIVAEAYPNGYTVEAPGAGLEITARNIRRDLLDLLPERKISF